MTDLLLSTAKHCLVGETVSWILLESLFCKAALNVCCLHCIGIKQIHFYRLFESGNVRTQKLLIDLLLLIYSTLSHSMGTRGTTKEEDSDA